ncbi:hypothetical protein BGZ61DRAFT_45281 [Ilyonectria robusta]|uniref:uncharacterized protein n=1 Tax=Ilyonectria robusta TaxID=1079257 RepID=UPI001E8DDDCF|nr:uncharacterized protein BGZ61DRAFT_45281 [Ilyonectria robusta]KAH8686755.1 hypothetical protein BGZ61DRAFT_45281 [Ilyonectria robusta]
MDGSGYNDQAKLKAALELAKSFKKGKEKQHRGKGGSITGGNKSQPTLSDQRNHQYPTDRSRSYHEDQQQRQERPPPNVPPPSQRSYTNTLVSDPSKISSGPIMGSKALDFLCRQDHRVKPETPSVPELIRKDVELVTAKPVTKEELLDPDGIQQRRSIEKNGYAFEAIRKHITPAAAKPTVKTMGPGLTRTQVPQPLIDLEISPKTPKDDMVDSFFSLMDQDIDEIVEAQFLAPTSESLRLANDETLVPIATQPVLQPKKCGQGSSSLEAVQEPTRPSPLQVRPEKGNCTEPQKENLRPKAPEFIPERVSTEKSNQGTNALSPIRSGGSKLSAEAMEWTPVKPIDVQNPPVQLHELVVPTGQSNGHLVSVTPIQFTDGRLIPGITTGQLYLQTPVNVMQANIPPSAPESGTMGTFPFGASSGAVAPTPLASDSSVATRKKPTKGLKASMWATK